MAPTVLGITAYAAAGSGRRAMAAVTAAGALTLVAGIGPTVVVGATATGLVGLRRVARARRRQRAATGDVLLLCELTALGLTAGLPFVAALEAAVAHIDSPLAGEVGDVLRRIHHRGAAVVLETADGHARPLYRVAGRAALTGAPVLDGVLALADNLRADERSRNLAVARRLPVMMLLPLALLILPGFLLLTVVPALLEAVARLEM